VTDLLSNTYARKTVLLTGHTGFKGSWLGLWLTELGARVIGYSLDPPTQPNLFQAIDLATRVTDLCGDIRDYDRLLSVFTQYRPEIVFHLAAQPLVRLSYEAPRETFEANIMGTVNLLEAVRHTPNVQAVVIVTSDKCYENREWLWGYREDEPMGGHDPYSASKGCCELATAAYLRSFFSPARYGNGHNVALASARAGNVIGGGDWGLDRLVPDCVRALDAGQEIVLRNPKAIRPWQHVLEPVSGYLLLGAKLYEEGTPWSGAWNFGPWDQDLWTVEAVVQKVVNLWGQGGYRVESAGHPHEAHWLKLDCSKARVRLGWQPRYNVTEALKLTVDWYRAFYSGLSSQDLHALLRHQILSWSSR
jgi:CDP-glucose 4,6-dehydratase